jgi:hypothetical protein
MKKMSYLNIELNRESSWKNLLTKIHRRVEVDLNEVNRVIELARRTPTLFQYENGLRQLSIFLESATRDYQQNDPAGLSDLLGFWERYRAAVIQRYTLITPVELHAADKIVKDIFSQFLNTIPNENIAYSKEAAPLVYGGKGGLGAYFTHPPGWNRPFAIINLPHTAFDNVWQWLALPHETGHDTYATVKGLKEELETALVERMTKAVENRELDVPEILIDLTPFDINYQHQYSGVEFMTTIWKNWANEAQADLVGLLSCGASAIIALQQIIGFKADDSWKFFRTFSDIEDAPEEHPTSYIRNALNIAALKKISPSHNQIADEIQTRFEALRPEADDIKWYFPEGHVIAQCPVSELIKSAEIAADVILTQTMSSLGNWSYQEMIDFTHSDQSIVNQIADLLVKGDPTFSQIKNASPRHCLAATVFAFEKDPENADLINRTFKHFI